jgi:hypothetical protein
MSEKKSRLSSWPGLIPLGKRILYGGVREPKVKRYTGSTPTTSDAYESMDENYRWFRQDEMVRRCIVINGMFSTMTAGFETELEPTGDLEKEEKPAIIEKYGYVKEYIDDLNKKVNMDQVLFVSQVKRSIYGWSAWEIVFESENGPPKWLLSLQSPKIDPDLGEKWETKGFKYDGDPNKYETEEILYFTNLQLENDRKGLSDVEPIVDVCHARHNLLREDFPEITRTLWAPFVMLQADTTGMTGTQEDAFLDELTEAARSGKSVVFNRSVEGTVVKMDINFTGLVSMLDKFEEAIQREFGVPRFLLGKPIENRATAYAELEAYIQGPIAFIQRYFKRQIEVQWYDPWTKHILNEKGVQATGDEPLPVVVKHKWNPIRVTDVYEMATAVTNLYANGLGILSDYPDIAFDMMGWPQERLQEELEKIEKQRKEMLERSQT